MAAPQILQTTYDDLSGKSYLTAENAYIEKFKSLIQSDKLKVGIRWLSMPGVGVCNTLGDAYISRKFPAQLMFDAVMGHDNIQLYSLQRDEGVDDLPRMSGIVDLSSLLQSWEDTAAAMGKPTWIIIPSMPYYTWCLPGKKTPWYDSVILFRQEKYGCWQEPFEKIKEKLNDYTS